MKSKFESVIHTPTKALRSWLRRWEVQIANALLTGQGVTVGKDGIVLFDDKKLSGQFFHRVPRRERDLVFDSNLVVTQGIQKALGVMFHSDQKVPNWYVAMFKGSTAPSAGLTGANVASTLDEITSLSEGYSEVTRPQWNPSAPVAGVISSEDNKAEFTIACATSIIAKGAFLISENTRGGTTGTLWSAANFDADRELFDGETFELGYRTSLTM
jgi:hypothetical protein